MVKSELTSLTTRVTPIVLVVRIVLLTIFFNLIYLSLAILSDYLQGQVFQLIDFDVFVYLMLFIAQTAISLYLLIRWGSEYYVVTHDHVIHKSGIIVKREQRYALENAEVIKYTKGFLGRLLGYGDIEIVYPSNKMGFCMKSIANPEQFIFLIESRKK